MLYRLISVALLVVANVTLSWPAFGSVVQRERDAWATTSASTTTGTISITTPPADATPKVRRRLPFPASATYPNLSASFVDLALPDARGPAGPGFLETATSIAAGGGGDPILFGQRRVGPRFSTDKRFPNTSGKTIDEVAEALVDPRNPLTPDDLPITVFRDPKTGSLVSTNTRTRAALARAGVDPTRVELVELSKLPRNERLKLLRRLRENPIIENAPLPGPRVPVTPTMKDLTVLDIIEIQLGARTP